jgi:heptose I phosphotransferase
MLKVLEEYRHLFPETRLQELCSLDGEVFKRIQNRRTFRVERSGRRFFLKCHQGVGWREILKNLFSLRLPVLGAGNEWRAIHRLQELGVETMRPVAYGREGWNPAGLRSLLVTEELPDCISLERYCENWRQQPPPVGHKRLLIRRLASIARTLHKHGVNHRDFYICHLLIRMPWNGSEEELRLYLIDLHRVQQRRRTPRRWVIKDLGSLWFSAMELGLTERDLLRFMREYRQRPLREILAGERDFWRDVQRRADALYRTRPGAPESNG